MRVISILLVVIASTWYCVSSTKNPDNTDLIENAHRADATNGHIARFLVAFNPNMIHGLDHTAVISNRWVQLVKLWRKAKSMNWMKGKQKPPPYDFGI
ncbi:hypothetical protein Plhal304r1_c019g0067831 [Plasmopara halstedii]